MTGQIREPEISSHRETDHEAEWTDCRSGG